MENIDRNKLISDYYADGQEFYKPGETSDRAVEVIGQLIISEGPEAGESFMYGYADAAGKTPWNNIYDSMLKVGLTTEEIALFTVEVSSFFVRYVIARMHSK